jgi:plastocyanin
MKKRLIYALVILGVLVVLMGILLLTQNQNANPASNNAQGSGTVHNVVITDYMFAPSQLIINSGDTVVWKNNGMMGHTVTSDSGSEMSSPTLSSGASYNHTFSAAGTYSYHCSIHSSMTGVIIVQ